MKLDLFSATSRQVQFLFQPNRIMWRLMPRFLTRVHARMSTTSTTQRLLHLFRQKNCIIVTIHHNSCITSRHVQFHLQRNRIMWRMMPRFLTRVHARMSTTTTTQRLLHHARYLRIVEGQRARRGSEDQGARGAHAGGQTADIASGREESSDGIDE